MTDEPQETFPDPKTGEPLPARVLGGDADRREAGRRSAAGGLEVDGRAGQSVLRQGDRQSRLGPLLRPRPDRPGRCPGRGQPAVASRRCSTSWCATSSPAGYDLRHLHRRILNTARLPARLGDQRHERRRRAELLAPRAAADAGRAGARRRRPGDRHAAQARPGRLTAARSDDRTLERAIEIPLSRPRGDDSYVLKIFDKPQRTQSCDCERSSAPNLSQALLLLQRCRADRQDRRPRRPPDAARQGNRGRRQAARRTLPADAEPPADRGRAATARWHTCRRRARGPKAFEDLLWSLLNRQEFRGHPLTQSGSSCSTSRGCQRIYSRGDILHLGARRPVGLTLPNLLRAEQAKAGSGRRPKAKNVIFIWQQGGPPHQDMWDMKPDAPGRNPRRVQADPDQPARLPGLRADAAACRSRFIG